MVQSAIVPPGRYPLAIYGWNRLGMRDDYSIQMISANPELQPHITELLLAATDNNSADASTAGEIEETEGKHYASWCDARAEYQGQSHTQTDAQRASLRTTHKARITQLDEQLSATDDPRIQRMRHSQIETAETDFTDRMRALELAAERSEVLSEPIAFGTLEVVNP